MKEVISMKNKHTVIETLKRNKHKVVVIVSTITFIMMVTVNALANILPINGIGTGEVSDVYGNLFTPAGITFAVWGVIYVLLLGYIIYQLWTYKTHNPAMDATGDRIGLLFSSSSVANILWILAWHYDVIWLSLVLMIFILGCLIKINILTMKFEFNKIQKVLIRLPFSIYFGWITVATIANVITLLIKVEWNGFTLLPELWAVLILIIGVVISVMSIYKYNSFAYGLVIIWAYEGILIKHTSPDGFAGGYPIVITTLMALLMVLVLAEVLLLYKRLKKKTKL